jgi:hypothetical protein
MTSLLDIGPLTELVTVNGKEVSVYGVTPEGFFYLLDKFPELQKLMTSEGLDPALLREIAPNSIAYAVAVATTDRSEYKTSKEWLAKVQEAANVAMNISAHYQMALFQAALRLTFPDGIGPFMKSMETLANSIRRVSGKTAPATTSSKPSRTGFVAEGSTGMRLGRGAPRASSTH